jgi:fructose-bisphosphate aldolase class 1
MSVETTEMKTQNLIATARAMLADDKGLLAMDESNPTCNRRFARFAIPQTVEARRAYRELLVTTEGLGHHISGAILSDETIRQTKQDGKRFVDVLIRAGIISGIKVDLGAKGRLPWDLTFSFARAVQQPALELWHGDESKVSVAQQALFYTATCNSAARRGAFDAAMERTLTCQR